MLRRNKNSGSELREIRETRKESQTEFAAFLGCSQATVSNLERGMKTNDAILLRKLRALGLNDDDFVVFEALEVA